MSPISLWDTLRRGPKAVRVQPEASTALTWPSFAVSTTQRLAEKVGYLRDIDIFCDLTPEDMAWLAQATRMLTCQKGQIIYAPGETGEVLFLLKQGRFLRRDGLGRPGHVRELRRGARALAHLRAQPR